MEAKARATDQLLEAAVRLFGSRDPERVTIEEVAQLAGLSKGLIVYHFGSLEGLFRVAKDYLIFRFRIVWLPDGDRSLHQGLIRWAALMEEDPHLFRLLVNLTLQSASFPAWEQFRAELRQEALLQGASQAQAGLFLHAWEGISLRALGQEHREVFLLGEMAHLLDLLFPPEEHRQPTG